MPITWRSSFFPGLLDFPGGVQVGRLIVSRDPVSSSSRRWITSRVTPRPQLSRVSEDELHPVDWLSVDCPGGLLPGGVFILPLQADRHQFHHVSLALHRGAGASRRPTDFPHVHGARLVQDVPRDDPLLAMFSIPFSLWILKGFLDGVSLRYDETALINGGSDCTPWSGVAAGEAGTRRRLHLQHPFRGTNFSSTTSLAAKGTTMILLLATGGQRRRDRLVIHCRHLVHLHVPPILVIFLFQKYLLVGMTFGTVRGEV